MSRLFRKKRTLLYEPTRIAAAAHNLGRIMRKLFGVGKPSTLQDLGELAALAVLVTTLLRDLVRTSQISNRVTRSDFSAAAA